MANRVSQKVVEEKQFDSLLDHNTATMLGLCTDAIGGAVYAFNENTLYEVSDQTLKLLCQWFYTHSTILRQNQNFVGIRFINMVYKNASMRSLTSEILSCANNS